MRKYTEKGGITEERLYLGGWEIYRKRQGTTVTLERETLHLMDGNRRIAMVETKTVGTPTNSPLPQTVTRYQLDNHLQSASLELDETASVISYEEYYPYGDTSYRSARSGTEVSEKRYRYTGKEKDEETGLYYHGARYYAAWLGRWTAADPAGMVDGGAFTLTCATIRRAWWIRMGGRRSRVGNRPPRRKSKVFPIQPSKFRGSRNLNVSRSKNKFNLRGVHPIIRSSRS